MLLFGAGAAATATMPSPAAPTSTAPLQKSSAAGALPASLTSLPTYRRYVHPQAKAMAGIDWARITTSPLGRKLAAQIDAMGLKMKAAAEGLDFVADIEKVVLSSPAEDGGGDGGAGARLTEDAPFVISMQGHFKIDSLRKSLLGRKASHFIHQNAEVWIPPKGDTALAIINSQLMLIGDRKSLRATLDTQAEQNGTPENAVLRRADELAGQYDLWMVSEASLDGLGAGVAEQQTEMLKGLDQLELGVSFREGFKADVSLKGRTPEDTSKLALTLAGMKALAAMSLRQQQKKTDPELAAMLDKLEIGTGDGRVMLSAAFNQQEVDRGVESFMASRDSGGKQQAKRGGKAGVPSAAVQPEQLPAADAPASPLPPVRPPQPLMVRIYNADGGTREFKLNP